MLHFGLVSGGRALSAIFLYGGCTVTFMVSARIVGQTGSPICVTNAARMMVMVDVTFWWLPCSPGHAKVVGPLQPVAISN